MAFVNADLNVAHGNILNMNLVDASNGFYTLYGSYMVNRATFESCCTWNDIYPTIQVLSVGDYLIGDSRIGLKVKSKTTNINGTQTTFVLVKNNEETIYTIMLSDTYIAYPSREWGCTLYSAIDEDNQLGCLFFVYCTEYNTPFPNPLIFSCAIEGSSSQGTYPNSLTTAGVNSLMYELITSNLVINYQWKSVKSISGQLGTFRFSSLPDDILTGDAITARRNG